MRSKKFFLAVALICSFAVFASSQIIQTGTLSGTVRSDDQEPLPGVSVTITSPALITQQLSTVTGQRGNFRFSALPPGLYTVKYEMSGFNTLTREDVRVSVGQTVTLNDTLAQATLEASVTVRGESPVVDVTASSMTTSYGKEFLETVPQQRLRIGNYFSLIPGASNDRFHGSTPGDQAFMIDGVNISDPLSGGILASWGFDIMEELSVDTGALRAEFGNARGAVINAITKSGGNEFSGMASFYFRNKSFQADNTTGTPLAGRFVGFKFEDDASFQLGGPVVKNKLWFFLSGEYLWYDETVAGYPYDQPDNLPINRSRNYIPYMKLSWQISPGDKLIFSYNYKNFKLGHTSASQYRNEASTGIQNNPDSTFNLQYTKAFGSNFILDAKAGYVTHELAVRAKYDTVGIYDSVTRLYSENLYWNDISRRPRFQFTMNATQFKDNWLGSHEFKAGVDVMHGWYRTIDTYFTDPFTGLGGLVYLRNGVPDYIIHYEDFDRRNRILTIGGFIQDAWRPTQRLTLNLGLRIDHQEGIVPRQGQERSPVVYGGVTYDPRVSETFKPMIWDCVSPRVGLAWALDNVGKTVLKASYGRYFLTLYGEYFGRNLNPNSSISWRVHLNPDRTPNGDPYLFSAAVSSQLDPGLKIPRVDEFTVGIERELLTDTKLSLRYIRKTDRNIIEDVNMNALDMDALARGELTWLNYLPYSVTDPFNGQDITFYGVDDTSIPSVTYITNPPGAFRNYDGIEVIFNKRFSNRWQLFTSYVYANARGNKSLDSGYSSLYDDPNSLVNATGRETSVSPHQFKLQAAWEGFWGIMLGCDFYYLSGAPFTRTIRSNDLGLSLPQGNTTLLAEERGSMNYPDQKVLGLRAGKTFNLPGRFGQLDLMLDAFNVFNSNTTTSWETISSSGSITFMQTTGILSPRIFRLGARLRF